MENKQIETILTVLVPFYRGAVVFLRELEMEMEEM